MKLSGVPLAVLCLAPLASVRAQVSPPRPNIIFCMTDDQGWGDTGDNGLKKILTPALDAMAAGGVSLVPLLDGQMKQRPKPIGFWHHGQATLEDGPVVWNDNQYKLHKRGPDKYELYDLVADLSEKNGLVAQQPDVFRKMKAEMEAWQASVRRSIKGEDYPEKMVLDPPGKAPGAGKAAAGK